MTSTVMVHSNNSMDSKEVTYAGDLNRTQVKFASEQLTKSLERRYRWIRETGSNDEVNDRI